MVVRYNHQRKGVSTSKQKGESSMKKINIQAITEMGCCVYASINVSNDYTMNEIVREIKRRGFKSFRLTDSMKRFVNIQK